MYLIQLWQLNNYYTKVNFNGHVVELLKFIFLYLPLALKHINTWSILFAHLTANIYSNVVPTNK